jgi:hypothetical protein
MEVGMLWFDDSPLSIDDKIGRAVAFYTEKYGRAPTLCLINPETLNGGEGTKAGVIVRSARSVMKDHYWIGVSDEEKPKRAQARQRKAA